MAALSRPSLRSSARTNAGLDESSAPPVTRRRKRPRDSPANIHDISNLKKPKHDPHAHLAQPNPAPANIIVTSRNIAAVQPTANGASTIIAKAAIVEVKSVETSKEGDKRSLRSHDGASRSKSELSLYFPNYDELVGNEPKQAEFLTAETRLQIIEDPSKSTTTSLFSTAPVKSAIHRIRASASSANSLVNGSSQPSPSWEEDALKLNNAQRVDFSSIERNLRHITEDPLTDNVYFKAHRRAERQEKQLRNIEKERAQHEKVQLERILDGLKGHDWLKVMGISGVTDSEKKLYEPKRDHFIQEVGSLIEKFKIWKEEEKRRKIEKEQNVLTEEDGGNESEAGLDGGSDGDPPDFSDVDAWAARQLHQEASSATELQTGKKRHVGIKLTSAAKAPVHEQPFTSFYSKPYLREAALGKHRRGRARSAFGQPLPTISEQAFDLPQDMLTQDAIAASARSRRRAKRESKESREAMN